MTDTDTTELPQTGEYLDVREYMPGYYYRICPTCGAQWWETGEHGEPCPECRHEEYFRELGGKWAEQWEKFDDEIDYGIAPDPWYYPILHGMAREATDHLGYDVNIFHCKDYILAGLPEDHPRHETLEERREKYAD